MNIEEAKLIPMCKILNTLGIRPVKQNEKDSMYLSPLREEKTASFHVTGNLWHDFGDDTGGNTIDFVGRYLKYTGEHHTASDSLRWINNMTAEVPLAFFIPHDVSETPGKEKSLIKRKVLPITHLGLINYLDSRGINVNIAKHYLKELHVYNKNTQKSFAALGLKNEENGYELRNPGFKGSVGTKHISFIRGKPPKPEGIHIFEGMMDFLTLLTIKRQARPINDVIVLNSLVNLKHAAAYIKNYGYQVAYTWLDNDKAGIKATNALADFFKTEEDLVHQKCNSRYLPFKDYNAFHMDNLNLVLRG